jgi:DNA modification methylase
MYTFKKCKGYEGDLVLDMFNGTGATCVAAKALGRRYIGIEINKSYCRSATNRVAGVLEDRGLSIFTKRFKLIDPVQRQLFEESETDGSPEA